MPKDVIEIRFSGGLNFLHTGLDLALRQRYEAQSMINCDLSYPGKISRLLPLKALNSSAASALNALFVANGLILVVDGSALKYGTSLTSLIASLTMTKVYFDQVGYWVFIGTGLDRKAVYTPGPTACGWGQDIPTAAPTVAAAVLGAPTGTPVLSGGSMADATYYYVITAVMAEGETGKGTESAAITIAAGGGFASVNLAWTAINGAISYKVYRTTTSGVYTTPTYIANPSTNSYTDTAASPSAGAPPALLTGTYSCYYRYKITLPDGTIIRTALSPVGSVTVTSQNIQWSGIVHASFLGATTNQVELFRTSTAMASVYLVTTLNSGTTTYFDGLLDAALQANTVYAETGYYPPPSNPSIVKYYAAADRLFAVVGGDVYWSEPGLYHIFKYNALAGDYTNVNSVFLGGEDITAVKLIDENLYFGSKKGWRRLRGRSPDSWLWEDTSAIRGPINHESAIETSFGVIYPATTDENDTGPVSRLWLFSGFDARPILEEFVFSTPPSNAAHATFDGRFYRLFYEDTTNPELVVDFYGYPRQPPRIVQSTRTATASFFDKATGKLYLADSQYVRQGKNTSASVVMSLRTAEVPPENLAVLGSMGKLIIKINTKGDNLTITPILDGKVKDALTVVSTEEMEYKQVPIRFGDCRTIAFNLAITSTKDISLIEPIILCRE